MTTLALIRHGQTDWNLARRVQGTTDVPLNDTGRDQARTAAEVLRNGGYTRVVTSPMIRARETAAIIAEAAGLGEPAVVPTLHERDYGEGEGMLVEEFHDRFTGVPVPGAETVEEVTARAVSAVEAVAADHPGDRTIVVIHGGVIRALLAHASGGTLPRPGERVDNGSCHVLRATGTGLEVVSYEPVPAEAVIR